MVTLFEKDINLLESVQRSFTLKGTLKLNFLNLALNREKLWL